MVAMLKLVVHVRLTLLQDPILQVRHLKSGQYRVQELLVNQRIDLLRSQTLVPTVL